MKQKLRVEEKTSIFELSSFIWVWVYILGMPLLWCLSNEYAFSWYWLFVYFQYLQVSNLLDIFIPLIVCHLHQLLIMLQQLLHLSRLNVFLFPAFTPGKNHLYYFLLIHKTNIFFKRTIHSEKICIRIELKSKQDGAASESSSSRPGIIRSSASARHRTSDIVDIIHQTWDI